MDLPPEIDDGPVVEVLERSVDKAEICPPISTVALEKSDREADVLRTIEDRVLHKAIRQVEDALAWTDIDEGDQTIPPEWIAECGSEAAAKRRQRAALGAQKNAKEAPVGLKLSKEVFVGVVKARATEKAAPRRLNVIVGKIDFHLPQYERVKVDR